MTIKAELTRDGDMYIVEAVSIDYMAAGVTVEQAKRNFLRGLGLTIRLNSQPEGELLSRFVEIEARQ